MKKTTIAYLAFCLGFIILCIVAAPVANKKLKTAVAAPANDPLLELIGVGQLPHAADAMVFRCTGPSCNRQHDLAVWTRNLAGTDRIFFVDANTLEVEENSLYLEYFGTTGFRHLLYQRRYGQIYAIDDIDDFDNTWERLEIHVITNEEVVGSIPVNESLNGNQPVDRHYPVDGATLSPTSAVTGGPVRVYIDNPVNGSFDVVQFLPYLFESHFTQRFSYRQPLDCADDSYCSWHSNPGNSIAVDASNRVFIADRNIDLANWGQLTVAGPTSIDYIPVAGLFLCYVGNSGITAAPVERLLYVSGGCQSFDQGAIAAIDLVGNDYEAEQVIGLPYLDQSIIHVDWYDQKRVFAATHDLTGRYDPGATLYLHLIYDGQVLATLPVTSGYEQGDLRAMDFDPLRNRLYLAVGDKVYAVQVNYGGRAGSPPLPELDFAVNPDETADYDLTDGSGRLLFPAGTVTAATQVHYEEHPPYAPPTSSGRGPTTLPENSYPVRQFELTAVLSGTQTAVTTFEQDYYISLYTNASEAGPVYNDRVELYWWDGERWVWQDSSTIFNDQIAILSDKTGRFSVVGSVTLTYIPAVFR